MIAKNEITKWLMIVLSVLGLAIAPVVGCFDQNASCLAQGAAGNAEKVQLDPKLEKKVSDEAARLREAHGDADATGKKNVWNKLERDGADFLFNDPLVKNGLISDDELSAQLDNFISILTIGQLPGSHKYSAPLPKECVCKLYKKLRSGPGAKFTKTKYPWASDLWAFDNCPEEKKAVPIPKLCSQT